MNYILYLYVYYCIKNDLTFFLFQNLFINDLLEEEKSEDILSKAKKKRIFHSRYFEMIYFLRYA